jgi:glycerol-3-phosphate dehydrogenase
MPDLASRPSLSSISSNEWDVLVIGGGITGAGIMREIARLGKRVLLVERGDFASGTSSRSSKMMHGGLHYLARLQLGLVRVAVHERQQVLSSGSGLAEQVSFFLLTSASDRPAWLTEFGLTIYDLLAGQFPKRHAFDLARMVEIAPGLDTRRSTAAFSYREARIDDARLVLRVLQEGCRMGGLALNYVEALDLLHDSEGEVVGARLRDRESGCIVDVRSRALVNATGPWTD